MSVGVFMAHAPSGLSGNRRVVPLLGLGGRQRRKGYQGANVPDMKALGFKRSELRERFDDLYHLLNPKAATASTAATTMAAVLAANLNLLMLNFPEPDSTCRDRWFGRRRRR
jgi:hypothetical protein